MANRPTHRRKGVDVFESTAQKTNLWLKDVERGTRCEDRPKAYAALRAVLHVLRECLPIDETAKLAAQMPMLVRGIFFDGWKPRRKPLRLTKAEFFRELRECLRGQPDVDCGLAARAVFRTIETHVSPGECAGIKRVLPHEIRALWRDLTRETEPVAPPEPEEVSLGRGDDWHPEREWQPGWAARQYGERSGGVTDIRAP